MLNTNFAPLLIPYPLLLKLVTHSTHTVSITNLN